MILTKSTVLLIFSKPAIDHYKDAEIGYTRPIDYSCHFLSMVNNKMFSSCLRNHNIVSHSEPIVNSSLALLSLAIRHFKVDMAEM